MTRARKAATAQGAFMLPRRTGWEALIPAWTEEEQDGWTS